MWTGIVKGSLTATIKHPAMAKGRLLIVQPIHPFTGEAEGFAQVVADVLGAGFGQRVLVCSDGLGAQRILGAEKDSPVRLAIVAILQEGSIHSRKLQKGRAD